MAVNSTFFNVMARAVLAGFANSPNIMRMVTPYPNLKINPGSDVIDVPIWQAFTVRSMEGNAITPCNPTDYCDDPTATTLQIYLKTQYIPTRIALNHLNIMSNEQLAGMFRRIIRDLAVNFEIGGTAVSVFDNLFTDAMFNGAAAGSPIQILADSAAGYRNLANAINRAKAKNTGAGVAFIGPPDLMGFIDSIPDRQIDRMLGGIDQMVIGSATLFAGNIWGTTYTGKIGFLYPLDALVYAAPGLKSPNTPMDGYAGNMWLSILDVYDLPGRALVAAHQYGLKVVREGDIQMVVAP